jgi:hypothetical protein
MNSPGTNGPGATECDNEALLSLPLQQSGHALSSAGSGFILLPKLEPGGRAADVNPEDHRQENNGGEWPLLRAWPLLPSIDLQGSAQVAGGAERPGACLTQSAEVRRGQFRYLNCEAAISGVDVYIDATAHAAGGKRFQQTHRLIDAIPPA